MLGLEHVGRTAGRDLRQVPAYRYLIHQARPRSWPVGRLAASIQCGSDLFEPEMFAVPGQVRYVPGVYGSQAIRLNKFRESSPGLEQHRSVI